MSQLNCLVPVSIWDRCRIYILGVVFGVWIFLKTFLKSSWKTKEKEVTDSPARSNPPPILVDSTLGKHSYIKIKGVKFHYVECGPRDAPAVLLLHGFPDCWVCWRTQMEALGVRRRVLALDLQGCGDSDKPQSRRRYQPHDLVAPIVKILKALKADAPYKPATLLAHDLGGLLGWYLAHEVPELIDRLVVISSPHPNIFWDSLLNTSPFNSSWMYAAQLPYLMEREALLSDSVLLSRCHPHLIRSTSPTSMLEAYKYVFSRYEDWTGAINYFRSLIFWRVEENQGQVRPPVLLITGNKDPQVSLESVVRSAEWCEQAIVKIVEGAGHHPHVECPDHVNRLLLDFLGDNTVVQNKTNGVLAGGGARALVGRVLGAVHLFT